LASCKFANCFRPELLNNLSMKYTITIDCDDKGNLSYWTQKKELKPPDLEKFERLKVKVEKLITTENVKQLELN
jgi:hypothetical protein